MFCNESKNTLQKCNANLFVAFSISGYLEEALLKFCLYRDKSSKKLKFCPYKGKNLILPDGSNKDLYAKH